MESLFASATIFFESDYTDLSAKGSIGKEAMGSVMLTSIFSFFLCFSQEKFPPSGLACSLAPTFCTAHPGDVRAISEIYRLTRGGLHLGPELGRGRFGVVHMVGPCLRVLLFPLSNPPSARTQRVSS